MCINYDGKPGSLDTNSSLKRREFNDSWTVIPARISAKVMFTVVVSNSCEICSSPVFVAHN